MEELLSRLNQRGWRLRLDGTPGEDQQSLGVSYLLSEDQHPGNPFRIAVDEFSFGWDTQRGYYISDSAAREIEYLLAEHFGGPPGR
ncbi:MAG: hypothetical protein SFV54_08545 [Bryobacteraceae bacterium]|nr:hypothetical protein [Bryobacteraceae bacterium]